MLMNMRLDEHGVLHRVDATCEVRCRHFTGLGVETGRANALWYGQRVQIDDAADLLMKILEFDPEG